MAALNLCQFIGNVGSIDTRYMPSGEAVTNISIAVNSSWKDKDGNKKEHSEWIKVSMFGKLAEIAATYVTKGSPLYVAGEMRTRKYTDKDGIDKYTTEIRANSMQMLGGRPTGDNQNDQQSSGGQGRVNNPNDGPTDGSGGGFDDDIPFAPVRWDSV